MKTRKAGRRTGIMAAVAATTLAAAALVASIAAGAHYSITTASQPVVATIVQF